MKLFARAGRRSDALRQYQVCVHALERELGAEPSIETNFADAMVAPDGTRVIANNTLKPDSSVGHISQKALMACQEDMEDRGAISPLIYAAQVVSLPTDLRLYQAGVYANHARPVFGIHGELLSY